MQGREGGKKKGRDGRRFNIIEILISSSAWERLEETSDALHAESIIHVAKTIFYRISRVLKGLGKLQ